MQVAVRAAGTAVEMIDSHLQAARPQPLADEVRVGMRTENLFGRSVEVPGNPDERHLRVDGDVGVVGPGGHDGDPFWPLVLIEGDSPGVVTSGMDARTSSRRR